MQLKYTEKGSEDSAITIVFIHAFPMNRTMWDAQVDHLSKFYRVISVDLPGYGESEGFPESQDLSTITLSHYYEALEEFLKQRNVTKAIFAGCSMGGYLLFEIFRRSSSQVAGFMFCCTRAEADSEAGKEGRLKTAQDIQSSNSTENVAQGMPTNIWSEKAYKEKAEYVERVRQWIRNTPPKTVIGGLHALRSRPDSVYLLPNINVPSLVITGTEDPLTGPEVMEPISKQVPNATTVFIEGAGHLAPFDSPKQVNEAMEAFLKKNF